MSLQLSIIIIRLTHDQKWNREGQDSVNIRYQSWKVKEEEPIPNLLQRLRWGNNRPGQSNPLQSEYFRHLNRSGYRVEEPLWLEVWESEGESQADKLDP